MSKSRNNETISKTIIVALLLCLVCSIIVSTAAVLLKPAQIANKNLDKQKNILMAAGLLDEGDVSKQRIEKLFNQVQMKIVELASGEYTEVVDIATYNQRNAAKDPAFSNELSNDEDIAGINRIETYAHVYLIEKEGQLDRIVLPIHGYGLWSTLYGFLALEGDGQTVVGLGFYDHAETPGLGGEVDNPRWKALWVGKKIYNEQGEPAIQLVKGNVDTTRPGAVHKVDALAGATLTSRGVENLIQFWTGSLGFGPYLKTLKTGEI